MDAKLMNIRIQGTATATWPVFEVVHPSTGEVRKTTQPEFEQLQAQGFVKKGND